MKARLFVLTLQDHYRDLFDNATNAERPDTIANDEWALEYMSLNWLRPLMEAFDDDASGYVTITEVNKLMDMRPSSLTWRYVPVCMRTLVCFEYSYQDLLASRTGWRTGPSVRVRSP